MNLEVIGGGPGGLYAAALLAKEVPGVRVRVTEKNPPGVTYGFGVVFSEGTLSSFREADYRSYEAITDAFVRWDAIDVRYRDTVLRCGGHGFAAIARRELLAILERRCEELGVEVRHGVEMSVEEAGGADLVIAADGVHSVARAWGKDIFKPAERVHSNKYIWLATDRVFDSFTFAFTETPNGLFQAHVYSYDGQTSTFIVETTAASFEAAGLGDMDVEASIAFCEELFAEDLSGHRLFSNNSKWISFVTLRNASWHKDNVVLLGDAAHTAHFSIGSGTKLAMEDSISLARAIADDPKDLEGAVGRYQAERKPVVAALQRAALESSAYFESTPRYMHMDPEEFAFNLMTRSGRLSYDNLRRRDARFVELVDGRFSERSTGRRPRPAGAPGLQPFEVPGLVFSNRFVRMMTVPGPCNDGAVDGSYRREAAAAAMMPGLVLTPPVAVSAEGRVSPGSPGIYDSVHVGAWRQVVDDVHSYDVAAGILLSHAGRRASCRFTTAGCDRPLTTGGWTPVAPSSLPYFDFSPVPREATRDDLERIVGDFEAAGAAARDAGFDIVFVDAACGYLLASFLSPLTNLRADDFGGDVDGRIRFPARVVEAVRRGFGRGPVGVRLNGSDFKPRGMPVSDAVTAARALGADVYWVMGGHTVPGATGTYDRYYLTPLADAVRNEARVKTIASGRIIGLDEVNTVVAAGRADMCVLDPPAWERTWPPASPREA